MKSVTRAYIGFQLFFNLLLWVPIFYEFQKRMGLSDPQIFGIQSVYYIAFCLFEIPTGFLADRFGYKSCMIAGALFLVGANLLPVGFPTYAGFMVHFLAIALARSLISGASSAYLYEYLRARGETDLYRKMEGDARFWSLVARIIAGAAAAPLMILMITLPYWISAGAAMMALVLAIGLPEVHPGEGTNPLSKVGYRAAVKVAFSSPRLMLLMLQGVGLFVMARLLIVNLFQPLLGIKGFELSVFGAILGLAMVCEAVGSRLAHRLRPWLADRGAVTALTIVMSISLIGAAYGGQAMLLFAVSCFSLAMGLAAPVQKQLMNDAIPEPRLRATLLSCESIVDRAVCAIAVLPLGNLVGRGLLSESLAVAAVGTTVVALAVHGGFKLVESSEQKIGVATPEIAILSPVSKR